jgi:outer membrane protein OmpA-like peptidoglycan-associated protein
MEGILCAGGVSGYEWRRQTGQVQLMAFFENGGQPRDARAFVQAWHAPACIKVARSLVLVCFACVGGCSNYHTTGPEAWWHEAIGGKIAEDRPPPPGDKDPYPNLATVPAKPPPANIAEWNQMTAGLINDRIKADQAAALAPIQPAASGAPAAMPFGSAPQASTSVQPSQDQAQGASAALTAATAPPAAHAAPRAEPPPVPGSSGARAAASASGPVTAALSPAERVANGQLPALPTQEPPRPGIAPAPPPPLIPATAAPPLAAETQGTPVDFDQGSVALNDPALTEVKALAAVRGDRGIAVTGYGGATSSDPLVQSDALGLGLSRAQALATALVAQGVPNARIRLNAEAAGRGASLRLLE